MSRKAVVLGSMMVVAACDANAPKKADVPPPALPPAQQQAQLEAAKAADPMAKLDADMKEVMDQLAALGGKPIETLLPDEARRQPTPTDAVMALLRSKGKSTDPIAVAKVEEKKAGDVPVRIYTPKEGKAPFPVIVYYHGGGFVIATNDTYDSSARGLSAGAEAIVVAVEYRKAPEHKLPAAHDDATAAYNWVVKNAKTFGGDPARVAVVGESAGGNLALNVSLGARNAKQPMPVYQVLIYPLVSADMTLPSYSENENAKPLNKAMVAWFVDKYLPSPEDAKDPRIDTVNADLTGLPPTTIITAQIDPIRSNGELLGDKLRNSGVTVDQKNYEGVTHEFFGMGAVVGDAKDALDYAVAKLKDAFKRKA